MTLQIFSRHTPAHPDTMGENNTPTAPKGCGVKRGTIKPMLLQLHSYLPPAKAGEFVCVSHIFT